MYIRSSKHQKGIRTRQAVLEHVRKNPDSTGPEIIAHFGLNKVGGAELLKAMFDKKELSRTSVVVQYLRESDQAVCHTQTFRYSALKEFTEGWLELQQHENPVPQDNPTPWLTRNTDPQRKPLQGQGGQGALRGRVWAASTADMV